MAYSHVAAQHPSSAPSAPTSSLPSVLDGEACAPRTPWHTPRRTHCAPTFARRTRHRTRAPSLSARKAGEDGSPRPQAALKVWGAHPKWPVPGPRLDLRYRPPPRRLLRPPPAGPLSAHRLSAGSWENGHANSDPAPGTSPGSRISALSGVPLRFWESRPAQGPCSQLRAQSCLHSRLPQDCVRPSLRLGSSGLHASEACGPRDPRPPPHPPADSAFTQLPARRLFG